MSSLSQFWIHPLQFHLLLPPSPPETAGSSSTSKQPSEHIPITSRDFLVVMDLVHALTVTITSLAASQTTLAKRIARAEVTLAHNQAILLQIQSNLVLPPVTVTEPIQPTTHDHCFSFSSLVGCAHGSHSSF